MGFKDEIFKYYLVKACPEDSLSQFFSFFFGILFFYLSYSILSANFPENKIYFQSQTHFL